jgi:hypothetical protein
VTRTLAVALAGVLLAQAAGTSPEYRFVEVKSKVTLTRAAAEKRVAAGDVGLPGDEVRTGWLASAVLAVPERASRFELLPSTRVVLGGPEPGVLVVLERGRLKAIFDALTGNEERLVATPGALLAVRGTRYGVEVAADGTAELAVFEGTVEVRPRAAGLEPVPVRAGQMCRFGPREAPRPAPMPRGAKEESWRGGLGAGDRQGGPPSQNESPPGQSGQPGSRPEPRGQHPGGGHG